MKKIIALALVLSVFNINNTRAEDALPPECDLGDFECTHDCDEYRPYMDQLHEYYHNRYLCLQNTAHIMLKTEEKQKLYDELIQSFREVLWDFDSSNIYVEGSTTGHTGEPTYTEARETLQIYIDNYLRGKKYDAPDNTDMCSLVDFSEDEEDCFPKMAKVYTQNYVFNGYISGNYYTEPVDFRPRFEKLIQKAMNTAKKFYKLTARNDEEYRREWKIYNTHLFLSLDRLMRLYR